MRPLVVALVWLFAAALVASPALAVSGGPGSVSGFGSDYEASVANGTATYAVPIDVPPGAGGLTPELALRYEGGAGISEVGLGWSLGELPRIRLRTANGLPRFDGNDAIEIVGFGASSDLVPIGGGLYRPAYEAGEFVRVERAQDGWEARDKAGTIYRFGAGGAVEAEGAHVATWLLTERLDVYGHRVAYAWDTTGGWALLTGVVWNDYDPSVRAAVTVSYEDRPDAQTLYAAGMKRVLAKRARAIEVTEGGALVRRYELAYAAAKMSLLARVTVVGRDGASRLPPTTFEYTSLALATSGAPVTMKAAPGVSLAVQATAITDLDGDGLPDFLLGQAGAYRSYLNGDGTTWRAGRDWGVASSPSATLNATGVWLADLNADGADDLAILDASGFRYLPGAGDGSFGAAVVPRTVPAIPTSGADTRMSDVDGDQRADFLTVASTGITVVYNVGGTDWSTPQTFPPVDPTQTLAFSDGHTTLCDLNGDRIDDLCTLRSGSLRYWLGRGRGAFEAGQTASGVPAFDPSSPWVLRDVDGDGWFDLLHVGVDEVDVALAKAPGSFDAPQTSTSTATVTPTTVVELQDMNGSGTDDILWVDGAAGGQVSWKYLELFPGGRGGLLRRVDNGRGLVEKLTYGNAAEDAAAARAAGHAWTTRIDVAMPVLRRVEIDRSLGDPIEATEFAYGQGTYSADERTFAGFGSVVARRLGDDAEPTLVTETTYDTGLSDRNLRGKPLAVLDRDEQGNVFTRTVTTYATVKLDVGGGASATYSYPQREEVSEIEGPEPSAARTVRTEWEEDAFGSVTKESAWGEVRGGDVLYGNDERITIRTFANDTDDWLLGFVASEELQDGQGHRVRLHRTYYDGAAFQGLPLGQVGRGNPTREDAWVGPGADDFTALLGRAFDGDGHVIETRDPRGGGETFEWDGADHTFLRAEHRRVADGAADLVTRWEYDRGLGVVTSETAPNGGVTATEYDPFGRVAAVVAPGDTHDRPTLRRTYQDGAPLGRVTFEARVRSGEDATERSETVVDGDGAERATFVQLADGRWVESRRVLRNARGEARKALRAAFVGDDERASPALASDGPGDETWRDARGRTVRTRTALGLETATAYAPLAARVWGTGQTATGSAYEHTPTVFDLDGLGRIVARTETLAGSPVVARFAYDAAGALVMRTDAEGGVSTFAYDGLGRRTSLAEPTVGAYAFAYDETGDLVARTRPDGTVQRFAYDLAGRLLTEDWDGDGTADATRRWDARKGAEGDPNGAGQLASIEDPSGSLVLAYDARGQVASATRTIDGKSYRIGVAYDAQGRPATRTFPDGSTIAFAYDARGLVTSYGDAVAFEYDAEGSETKRTFSGGVVQVRKLDADERPATEVVTSAAGAVIQSLAWAYDEAGRLRSVGDLRPGIDAARDRSEAYAYDNLYRLVHAMGTWGDATWSFSPTGNTLARASSVDALDAKERAYGAAGRPQALAESRGRKPSYDALGRMTDDGQRRYAWSARDMATSVEGGGARVDSVYDASEQRRLRTEHRADGSVHTTHFVDAWTEVQDGALVRYLVKDGRRIARLGAASPAAAGAGPLPAGPTPRSAEPSGRAASAARAAGVVGLAALSAALAVLLLVHVARAAKRHARRFVVALAGASLLLSGVQCGHGAAGPASSLLGADARLLFSDSIGSLTEVTTPAGDPVGSFAAYPGGVVRYDTTGETRTYANAPYDASVGVAPMGARVYAPDLGVWTSVDPDGAEVPDRFVAADHVEANAYAYAGDDAANRTDESGHMPPKPAAKKAKSGGTKPSPKQGPVAELHYMAGWTDAQKDAADAKIDALNKLAAAGKLQRTVPNRSPGSASAKWRRAGKTVAKGNDIDHKQDLQLGGDDVIGNMWVLDRSVNRSLGSQIYHATKDVPLGTRLGGFTIDD